SGDDCCNKSEVEQASTDAESSAEERRKREKTTRDVGGAIVGGEVATSTEESVSCRSMRSTRGTPPTKYGDYKIDLTLCL
ncbi:jg25793, partial [Pararge aegeria aegeria]